MNTFKVNFISLFDHTEQITIRRYSHQVKENKLCGLARLKRHMDPTFFGLKVSQKPIKRMLFSNNYCIYVIYYVSLA